MHTVAATCDHIYLTIPLGHLHCLTNLWWQEQLIHQLPKSHKTWKLENLKPNRMAHCPDLSPPLQISNDPHHTD